MSDQKAQAAAQGVIPNAQSTGPAILYIKFERSDGTAVGNPIEIKIPRELSKRLVKMYLLEMMMKLIKSGMDVLVSGLGW